MREQLSANKKAYKRRLSSLGYVFKSMRPKQWLKNGFVFAGLIFSGTFFQSAQFLRSFVAFLLFCLVSGSAYIINDIFDKEKDALHPEKCLRPIASGELGVSFAGFFAAALAIVSFVLGFFLNTGLAIILIAYFLLVLAYSAKLKNFVIVDVLVIAAGFVLRTVAGTVVINVEISPWLLLCTTMLALFLALMKRKSELLLLSDEAENHRKNLGQYSPALIDNMLSVITSTTVMSYCLYTFSAARSSYMMLTIPFVLYGIFRYQYLASAKGMGASPEKVLLGDKPLLIDILLWVAACVIIISIIK